MGVPQFMYGSHYSSPGVVLQYMIRQEPYTKMAVNFQGGRFDVPDRLFCDIASSWKSLLTSVSDVKELIPEFFYCPEMLLNTQKLPLGELQDGRIVGDVVLPPWAKKSPYEFIRLHREALESDYVSANLNHWIDLIFGHKQTGEAAVSAKNLFFYLTYENAIDIDSIVDPLEKDSTICQVINFGQTPSKIFDTPHVTRLPRFMRPYCFQSDLVDRIVCITPPKQAFFTQPGLGAVVLIRTFAEKLTIAHSCGSIRSYRWSTSHDDLNALQLTFAMGAQQRLDIDLRKVSDSLDVGGPAGSLTPPRFSLARMSSFNNKAENTGSKTSPFALKLSSLRITACVLDGSGGRVITCGYWDNAIKVFALDSGKELASAVSGHVGAITCVHMDRADNGMFVSGGVDGTCRLWVLEDASLIRSYYDELRPAALESGVYTSALVCLHVLYGHHSPITSLFYSADMDLLVSGSKQGNICLHATRKGDFIRTLQQSSDCLSDVLHISVHGYIFAYSKSERTLRSFWINGSLLHTISLQKRFCT